MKSEVIDKGPRVVERIISETDSEERGASDLRYANHCCFPPGMPQPIASGPIRSSEQLISCTTIRAQSTDKSDDIQYYRSISNTYPSSCQYRGTNGSIDFSNPSRIVLSYNNLHSASWIVLGDSTHGYPMSDKMTNITCWLGQYYLCFAAGLLWSLDIHPRDRTSLTWRVISNASRQGWDNSSDFVALVGDSIALVRFLPNRESCERVNVYTYALSAGNPMSVNYVNTSTLSSSIDQNFSATPMRISYVNPFMQAISPDRNSSGSQTGTTNEHSKPEITPCKICLSDDSTIARSALIPCGHVACFDCIGKALMEKNICPFCRGTVGGLLRLYE